MSYKKNGNNKAYENLKANPDVKKHMLEACIMADKEDSLVANADGQGIRRIGMKKKEYGEIFKKVAVASLSLAATGAIVAGVATYRNDNNLGNNSMVAKETTIKETQANTEKEIKTQNIGSKKLKKSQKYGCICMDYCDDEGNIIEYNGDSANEKNHVGEYGKYLIMQTMTDSDGNFDIKVKDGNTFKKVDSIKRDGRFDFVETKYYGDNLYYFDYEGLRTLNLKTCKADYVFKYSEADTKLVNNLWHSYIEIDDIYDNYIYISGYIDIDEKTTNPYIYSYDRVNKKLNKINDRYYGRVLKDDLIITKEKPEYKMSGDCGSLSESPIYIERKVNGNLETIKKLGNRVWALTENDDNYLSFSKKNKDKLYYVSFEKIKETSESDYSEITVMSYDIKTNETEKIDTFNIPNMSLGDKGLWIQKITDDCIKLYYQNTKNHQEDAEYNFKNKKFTHEEVKVVK